MACFPFKTSLVPYIYLTAAILFLVNGGDANLDQTSEYFSASISSMLPSSTCKSSAPKGHNGASTLCVVDTNGACYERESGKQALTLAQILNQDQSRVNSIQSRHASPSPKTDSITVKKAKLPSQSGASLGTGNYIVQVGLGTPKKYYSLVFDTGSDLTWTQCMPCVENCYKQKDPIFNPSQSKSYSNISCLSAQCSMLINGTSQMPGCLNETCVYGIQYGDQSYSVGFFAKDNLTLGSDVFPSFLFGCGQNNKGLFGRSDGLLGLGRSQISVVSQTAKKYKKVFSYCLPTTSGSNGYLSFGKRGISKKVKYTSFSKASNNYYFVNISGISIGGKVVPISSSVFRSAEAIIDSGTVVTRLPPAAYSAFRDAFKTQMKMYKLAPAFSILDTCYNFTGLDNISIPKVKFMFKGNAGVDLGINGILVAASQAQACLAFAGNRDPDQLGIFGNIQQQTQQVVYDVAAGKLGFSPGGCS